MAVLQDSPADSCQMCEWQSCQVSHCYVRCVVLFMNHVGAYVAGRKHWQINRISPRPERWRCQGAGNGLTGLMREQLP